jgi:hypothetical protein
VGTYFINTGPSTAQKRRSEHKVGRPVECRDDLRRVFRFRGQKLYKARAFRLVGT